MEPKFPEITHLGGEHCVTGSCHLMRVYGLRHEHVHLKHGKVFPVVHW